MGVALRKVAGRRGVLHRGGAAVDLGGPALTGETLRTADADPVTETLLETPQAATRPGAIIRRSVLGLRIAAGTEAEPETEESSFATGGVRLTQRGPMRGHLALPSSKPPRAPLSFAQRAAAYSQVSRA